VGAMTSPRPDVSLWACLPFLAMLLAIAVLPVTRPRFWEKNRNKLAVALVLSVPVLVFFFVIGAPQAVGRTLLFDYLPFLILLGSLFTITGSIHLAGDLEATPLTNTLFLAIGAVLASLMGTTGASMLLIRPVLKTNLERTHKVHTVLFFIAIVANTGGLLTPLGDPPLFMMYLRGAPFFWFLRMFPEWALANGLLLASYFLVDRHFHKNEPPAVLARDKAAVVPLKVEGGLNFVWLLAVVGAVALLNEHTLPFLKTNEPARFLREGVIVLAAVLSFVTTSKRIHYHNRFHWDPIVEVAYIFLGIFITMVPCLMFLERRAGLLGIAQPGSFYFSTGALSSFLDNTPTALAFHAMALGLGKTGPGLVAGIPAALLKAICVAAVFFGGMTYIGNGPNFMVKCVAEHQGIRMPHFFKYMLKFSLVLLLPVFILTWVVFLR
jgi:Na+/H+ antiporter NhaD/arsenite permease-like protein